MVLIKYTRDLPEWLEPNDSTEHSKLETNPDRITLVSEESLEPKATETYVKEEPVAQF